MSANIFGPISAVSIYPPKNGNICNGKEIMTLYGEKYSAFKKDRSLWFILPFNQSRLVACTNVHNWSVSQLFWEIWPNCSFFLLSFSYIYVN